MRCLIDFSDVLITGPTIEPLDLEEIKKQRRFSSSTFDTIFDVFNSAGRQDFEEQTNLALLTQTREFSLDGAPCQNEIQLNRAPVQSIESIKYDDGDGAEQTWDDANYTLVPKRDGATAFETFPGLSSIALVQNASWPTTGTGKKSMRIRYVCGYGSAPGAVPELIIYALHMFVGTAHKFSESAQDKALSMVPGVDMVIRNARTRRTLYPSRESAWQG